MGKRRTSKSQTLPSSPTHSFKSSSSSSDFEFAISISPRKSSNTLCPADELFYKGKLLPLHLSPRLSMVRTIILASSSSSSSSESAASRDSTASRSSNESSRSSFSGDLALLATVDCDSSRTSSVAEDDELKRLNTSFHGGNLNLNHPGNKPKFSLSRFSSVFRKEPKITRSIPESQTGSSVKRVSVSAKEVIRRYLKKVKPLYEKLSKQNQKMTKPEQQMMRNEAKGSDILPVSLTEQSGRLKMGNGNMSQSFSGNLGYPRRRKTYVASCPSSMRSSPNHSGALNHRSMLSSYNPLSCEVSSMEELQNAIQGAIMHCKNSMSQG
ncbi:probable membrane-associated kinase regulator 1 [Impatiens glandulifera]|uniref:probable membrane-associated kinase regulator 1 n=1 Tax=Impatiens glandulifera TaxID=253017 RepID=UPI001FB06CB8|nr:probable membrane-associated kinase regulator 1 [Impatiens glandulifera]